MKLTGKARIDFQEWMRQQDLARIFVEETYGHLYIGNIRFYDLPEHMQLNSYISWFETVGIYIGRKDVNYWWIVTDKKEYFKSGVGYVDVVKRRQKHAIDFAQRIYKGTAGI